MNKWRGKIKEFFLQEYFKSHIVLWLIFFTAVFNLANWLLLKLFIQPVDFPIILHYNVYFGVDMTGNWKKTYILPAIGLGIFVVNFFLSLYFHKNKDRIASYILMMAALMSQLSLIIASLSLIIINY
jgi:TRAP-type C4-dicarboxylate transport system permease large subunit